MGKKLALVGSDNCYHLGSKAYLVGDDGLYHSAKKIYKVKGGVYRLVFGGGVDVGAMVITYSADGGMTDAGIVTMGDGKQYRLLTLTKSGTLTVPEEVQAEVWMCGGGANGGSSWSLSSTYVSGDGGAGAYTATGSLALGLTTTAVVGAASGKSSFGSVATKACSGNNGGSGGGHGSSVGGGTGGGTGDGIDKHPFGDSTYFSKAHCAGGGGGGMKYYGTDKNGGAGGTNGSAGGDAVAGTGLGGAGGSYGGGAGGAAGSVGSKATFYGSGGGGGGLMNTGINVSGGVGYQGVIYIRIPVEQAA